MADAKKVMEEALAGIKPEKTKIKEADEFLKKVKDRIKKLKISARAVAGGSIAKGTFLKEDHDVDIFVKFSLKYKQENLSKLLKKILAPFKPETIHGSRDYFSVRNRLDFEIIPVLDIKKPGDARNVTDFSPLHVSWFLKNGKGLSDDVRLAKKFCKACNVYGAESYIQGFSGHVLDILIAYYKGFIPLLRASLKWKPKEVIDFYKIHKGKALFELNKSKTQGSLIVVDPVQPDRNAAAAVTEEKFNAFIEAARQFLKKPSLSFFTEKKIDKESLKKKGAIVLQAEPKKGKEDVAGAKLMKAFEFIAKNIEDFDFGVKKSGWKWDKKKNAVFWVIPKEKKLPAKLEWEGPPLYMENRVKEFKKKYKKTFKRKGRIYAEVKRKHTTPESLVKELIKKKYFAERVKKCLIY